MQIPSPLLKLYNHWEKHSMDRELTSEVPYYIDQELLTSIESFISERMKIWYRKQSGDSPPYSGDPILQKYRFCNIYRELDRQTIEIHTALKKYSDDFDLWLLNLAFQRFICNPQTVKKIGHLSFSRDQNQKVYKKLLAIPSPKYGSAYVFPISVIQKSDYPTREKFFCLYLPEVFKDISLIIHEFNNLTVNEGLKEILPKFGFNFRFHWTEILIDVAYQYPDKINLFKDFYIGPGAKPTIDSLSSNQSTQVLDDLVNIQLKNFPYLEYDGNPVHLSAENWEGIACEFRKYTNLSEGRGRVRLY